ncbi:hypothetical protein C3486_06980 [Streptomyces sp. Ru73]|uniref:hypothetical protein n=1 Tax=Streptomyces sp. Ru73 TaxID=2080748 RepID=UPI000CDD3505|nr:hypothetical protein [Streptomyces sp. Ru73]POX41957.1 hypothetical protein C3486_06980 [Streptomyces sp. Ru73]
MRKFIGRFAAVTALTAAAVVPLSGVASAQSQEAAASHATTSAAGPCWFQSCWGWGHDHYYYSDNDLIDVGGINLL